MKNDQDVMKLIEEAGVDFVPENEAINVPKFEPFPVNTLPGLLAEFVRQASKSIGCDETMVVNPLQAAIAGAIGNTRRVELKADWHEPSILWTISIAHSGDKKSPPFRLVKSFFKKHERQSHDDYESEMSAYKAEMARYKHDLTQWSKKKKDGGAPSEPVEPIRKRYVITDTTAEAVAYNLSSNPRGLILMRDELAGWFGSFGQYKNGGDADPPFWLECGDGGEYIIDRKGAKKTTIYIPRCSASINGTIQPGILQRCLDDKTFIENGMLARFLLSYPPERKNRWSDVEIDRDLKNDMQKMFDDLLGLGFFMGEGEMELPENVWLSGDAKELFIEIENQYGSEKLNCQPALKSYWSKMPGKIARIALQHHCVRYVTGESVLPLIIDADSMLLAIARGRWYANEASRVYAKLGYGSETDDARELREIQDVIRTWGGKASLTEIGQRKHRYRNPAERTKVEKVLRQQVTDGKMKSETITTGGAPKEVFILLE